MNRTEVLSKLTDAEAKVRSIYADMESLLYAGVEIHEWHRDAIKSIRNKADLLADDLNGLLFRVNQDNLPG